MMNFGGTIDLTTLDYPGKAAIVIFFRGCPFRCIYCHNHRLLTGENLVKEEEIEEKIKDASTFLSAVVFSGGEPFMQFDSLLRLSHFTKDLGLLVGIETEGYYPDKLRALSDKGLIDTLFLDVKAPLDDPALYHKITGCRDASEHVKATLDYALKCDFELEIRTTVFKGLIGKDEVERIACSLEGFKGTYVIQEGMQDLAPGDIIKNLAALTYDEVREMGEIAGKYIDRVGIRTKEIGLDILLKHQGIISPIDKA